MKEKFINPATVEIIENKVKLGDKEFIKLKVYSEDEEPKICYLVIRLKVLVKESLVYNIGYITIKGYNMITTFNTICNINSFNDYDPINKYN